MGGFQLSPEEQERRDRLNAQNSLYNTGTPALATTVEAPPAAAAAAADVAPGWDGARGEPQTRSRRSSGTRPVQEASEYTERVKRECGFEVRHMCGDGNCLFRAVGLLNSRQAPSFSAAVHNFARTAEQVYGDQEMHAVVRKQCCDMLVCGKSALRSRKERSGAL